MAAEQREKMEALRLRVTRFDALKQYLVQQHGVEEKEIDALQRMVTVDGYESDTFKLSGDWVDQLKCGQFIASLCGIDSVCSLCFMSSLYLQFHQ